MSFGIDLLTCALTPLLFSAMTWRAFLVSYRVLPDARPSLRFTATVGVALAVMLAAFPFLTLLGEFRRSVAIPLIATVDAPVADWLHCPRRGIR